MLLDVVDRRLDEFRLIPHLPDAVAGRQRGLELVQASFHFLHDLDRVGARLTAHLQQHGAGPVHVGDGLRVGFAVLDTCHFRDADGMAVLLANDDVVELGDGLDAAAGPQGQGLRSLIDASTRNLDVL